MHLLSDEDFFRQMNVNLIATRKLTNKILPVLRTSKQNKNARIIFISSISGIFAAPFNGGYCVSKHALECLIDIYRRELKFLNIDVIAIQPGPIKSQIWNKAQGMFDQYMHGEFEAIARKADKIIQSTEKNALPVDLVSKRIHKILEMKMPKHRYMIHKNSLLFKLVAYYMPTQWVDKLIWKNLNNTDTDKYRPV
jgi:NAD(P)-dependent dehydrogenase (short-subunit alcohol dehydrogenase family)